MTTLHRIARRPTEKDHAYTWIRSRIDSREYPPGSKLPGRAALAALIGVGEGAVGLAYKRLKGEGAIYYYRPVGMFVLGSAPEVQQQTYPVDEVIKYLTGLIVSHELAPGDRIPGYKQLRGVFPVSDMTLHRAITRMKGDCLLESRDTGKGVFVANTPQVAALRDQGVPCSTNQESISSTQFERPASATREMHSSRTEVER